MELRKNYLETEKELFMKVMNQVIDGIDFEEEQY